MKNPWRTSVTADGTKQIHRQNILWTGLPDAKDRKTSFTIDSAITDILQSMTLWNLWHIFSSLLYIAIERKSHAALLVDGNDILVSALS